MVDVVTRIPVLTLEPNKLDRQKMILPTIRAAYSDYGSLIFGPICHAISSVPGRRTNLEAKSFR